MRVGKILILVLLMLFFIKPVLAETTYTTTTDTICKNGVCTKTLYSGIRNVYEDNTWKRVEYARSLKDKGFNIITLEEDKDYPVEVIDFNYTSIKVKLNPKGVKVFNENIPLRVWNPNNEKAQQFEEDVRDGKKISKGIEDYKEKMDKSFEQEIGFNLLNQEEEMTLNFGMGKILEFGFNSTTIILQDADTENLEDTYVANNGEGYPEGNLFVYPTLSRTYIKFNISSIQSGSIILESKFLGYFPANLLEASEGYNISIHHVNPFPDYNISDNPWTEDTINGTNDPFANSKYNLSFEDFIQYDNSLSTGYLEWNTTQMVTKAITDGNSEISIYLNGTDKFGNPDSVFEQFNLNSKEDASNKPYLNITYNAPPDTTPPNVTINSPLNQTYNTNTILFNITATDNVAVDTCEYSLTSGTTNYSMSNSGDYWTATNSTMTQGSHTVNFYCNDTTGNLNNTEEIVFQTIFKTIGNRTQEYQMDEGSGIVLYDINSGLNGVLNGATWQDDGVDITLTEDTDYTLVTDSFTVINLNYAWRAITASYNYKDSQSSTTTIIARLSLLFIVLGILSFILLIINHYVKQI